MDCEDEAGWTIDRSNYFTQDTESYIKEENWKELAMPEQGWNAYFTERLMFSKGEKITGREDCVSLIVGCRAHQSCAVASSRNLRGRKKDTFLSDRPYFWASLWICAPEGWIIGRSYHPRL
jgi:hypothetical protein